MLDVMSKQRPRSLNRAALRRARKLMRGSVAVGLVAAGACSDGGGGPTSAANTGSGGQHAIDTGSGGMRASGSAGMQATSPSGGVATPPPMIPGSGMGFAGSGIIGVPLMPGAQAASAGASVLYSWTTDKQIDELRAKPVLLTRSENSDGMQTRLSAVISALADQDNALATVLTGGAFTKGRYAWTNPWATLRGWPGESYGNRLLRIELQPEAWLVVLADNVFSVIDTKGNPIAIAAALGTPERIAAVYYVNAGASNIVSSCGSFQNGCPTGVYREYFVNNEKMIKEWSFGTQQILDELKRSTDFLKMMRDQGPSGGVPANACELSNTALCAWNAFPLGGPLSDYMTGLAITSDYYVPTTANLDDLIKALQDAQFTPDDPVVHEP